MGTVPLIRRPLVNIKVFIAIKIYFLDTSKLLEELASVPPAGSTLSSCTGIVKDRMHI